MNEKIASRDYFLRVRPPGGEYFPIVGCVVFTDLLGYPRLVVVGQDGAHYLDFELVRVQRELSFSRHKPKSTSRGFLSTLRAIWDAGCKWARKLLHR